MPSKYFRSTDTTVELKDTMKLQKASLDLFAQELGYWWSEYCGVYTPPYGDCQEWVDGRSRGMIYISLRKVQLWHNHEFVTEAENLPYHGEDILSEVAERLGFTEDELTLAIESKLVQRTNLQYSKKRKELICVDHQISFK
ncbi:hypothetical protein S140_61 [Shewanella sp. phage 1/40]|uniref:hypothetical protein n=1 Tax=Shewanella sp. phage 1/40 TaxID=1458860 RepID=UPI0004F746C3|nr:hypothetical protein S140_61 [Shewanella sp. phage 1/40]AHK11471.1 hypothetical protein S140_61 [Shewanella sp. phage 1/40]